MSAPEMTPTTGAPASASVGFSLADFAGDARVLATEAFAARHGPAFLLHHGPLGGLQPATRPQSTVSFEGTFTAAPAPTLPPQLNFLVFPVKHTGRSPFPNFISVGRTPNNDVVINDVSISKFHAFFRGDDDGHLQLQDAGSSNGTFLGDTEVPSKDRGEPLTVDNGDKLRLGSVTMTFLTADALQNLIKRAL